MWVFRLLTFTQLWLWLLGCTRLDNQCELRRKRLILFVLWRRKSDSIGVLQFRLQSLPAATVGVLLSAVAICAELGMWREEEEILPHVRYLPPKSAIRFPRLP